MRVPPDTPDNPDAGVVLGTPATVTHGEYKAVLLVRPDEERSILWPVADLPRLQEGDISELLGSASQASCRRAR